MTIECRRHHVECPVFSPDINQIWNFSTGFHKSLQYHISGMSGSADSWKDGQTHNQTEGRTGTRTDNRDYAKAPEKHETVSVQVEILT
jgi:hypothetical protein